MKSLEWKMQLQIKKRKKEEKQKKKQSKNKQKLTWKKNNGRIKMTGKRFSEGK